jgi:peptidyl-prolyl cis-trans isomerase B (cyclophilin B)
MKKKLLAAFAAITVAVSALGMSGCTVTSSDYNAMADYDFTSIDLVQLEGPRDGDTIAIFDTDLGEIRAVLYDQYCPKTVAKFIERANAGEYNNSSINAIVKDTYFMAGMHLNDKGQYVGRDDDSEALEHEYNVNLWPFQGALVAYSELPGYSDARYIICDNDDTMTQEQIDELKNSMKESDKYTAEQKANLDNLFDKFMEVGGVFGMAGYVTVFGQAYEGIDVIEKITARQSDEKTYKPLEDIFVKSVTISTYSSEE